MIGTVSVSEKCVIVLTFILSLFGIPARDAKSGKLEDLSDYNQRTMLVKFAEGLKCVDVNILIILRFFFFETQFVLFQMLSKYISCSVFICSWGLIPSHLQLEE